MQWFLSFDFNQKRNQKRIHKEGGWRQFGGSYALSHIRINTKEGFYYLYKIEKLTIHHPVII